MTAYRRNFVPGGCFFFTVNLAERRLSLLTDHIEVLRKAFRETRRRHHFTIDAIVVLPDHLHTVWTLPDGDADFAMRWQLIKSTFSRSLPRDERISQSRAAKDERGIWQRRYWEHTIRDEADFARHVDYVHINPVKHGLVNRVRDWAPSSFHRHAGIGNDPADWAGDQADDGRRLWRTRIEKRWVSQGLNPSYELGYGLRMMRILVFPLLMPQFALLVFVAPSFLKLGLPKADFWLFAEQFAYFIVLIPACLAAVVDGVLFRQGRYLRLTMTAGAAAVLALTWAHYFGERLSVHYALVGAVPGALCSWISALFESNP